MNSPLKMDGGRSILVDVGSGNILYEGSHDECVQFGLKVVMNYCGEGLTVYTPTAKVLTVYGQAKAEWTLTPEGTKLTGKKNSRA